MVLRTPSDIGALIRDRRNKAGLGQAVLAERVGVSRKWLVEVEQGKPGAAIGLILRTLRVLDVALEVHDTKPTGKKPPGRNAIPFIDIDQHLERLRKS